jgi:hypothetical protein
MVSAASWCSDAAEKPHVHDLLLIFHTYDFQMSCDMLMLEHTVCIYFYCFRLLTCIDECLLTSYTVELLVRVVLVAENDCYNYYSQTHWWLHHPPNKHLSSLQILFYKVPWDSHLYRYQFYTLCLNVKFKEDLAIWPYNICY